MLRLRPSELTLTTEDVDEAFRRIASRRSLKKSRHVSPQQGRPNLRRGPQRAVRDAITTLGDIPILRPRQQRATHSSSDDQTEDRSEQTTPSPRARFDSVPGPVSPSQIGERSPAPSESPAPSSMRILHLPFRLGRAHRSSPTQSAAEPRTDGDISSPSHSVSRPTATPIDSVTTVETDQTISPTRPAPSPSQAELRGGGSTPPPFKSNQDDRKLPPPWGLDPDSNSDHKQPTLHLASYLNERPGDDRPRFRIRQVETEGWQTEPPRANERMRTHKRSFSSGSAPIYGLATQAQGHSTTGLDASTFSNTLPSFGDVFGRPPAYGSSTYSVYHPETLSSQQHHPLFGMTRQFSSEASAASGAYSFYELPPMSRQVSGSQAGGHDPAYPQYDGSAASTQASHGAYHSVRPLNTPIFGATGQVPRHTAVPGQYGVSPLPSLPYNRQNTHATSPASSEWNALAPSRGQSQGSVVQPPSVSYGLQPVSPSYQAAPRGSGYTAPSQGSIYQHLPAWYGPPPVPSGYQATLPGNGHTSGAPQGFVPATQSTSYTDAATAAMQGRPSPLDPYSQYYQQYLEQQNAQPPMSPQPVASYPIDRYSAGYRNGTADVARSPANRSQHPPVQNQYGAYNGRNVHTARAHQRSSENAPVRPSAQSSAPSRNSQVQRHREAFEAMHNWNPVDTLQPGQSRLSLPQPTVPRIPSYQSRSPDPNRPSTMSTNWRWRASQTPSSPPRAPRPANRIPSTPLDPSAPAYRPSASPDVPHTNPPSNAPNMRGGAAPDRTQTRARRRITPARSPNHLQPPRASLPLNHAVSLRSSLLQGTGPTRPIRRVPAQQRDQENSGAGEEQLMRQEAAAMHARYGEDVQRDVMDETPPRVGRVERRMFS